MTDLEKLDALAAAATPGPWKVFEFDDYITVGTDEQDDLIVIGTPNNETRADATFIAACDPATIRDLVAALHPEDRATDRPSEYGRLLAERDRLIADGVDAGDLAVPLPPEDRATETGS